MMGTFEENTDASWTSRLQSTEATGRTRRDPLERSPRVCVRCALMVDVLALDNALAIFGELHVVLREAVQRDQ